MMSILQEYQCNCRWSHIIFGYKHYLSMRENRLKHKANQYESVCVGIDRTSHTMFYFKKDYVISKGHLIEYKPPGHHHNISEHIISSMMNNNNIRNSRSSD